MPFSINSDKVSATAWGRVDKSMARNKLVKGLEEGAAGTAEAVREFYAGILSEDLKESPSRNWVLPHHELQGGEVVLNRDGLGAAAQRLDAVAAPAEKLREMAEHLALHYRHLEMDPPPSVAKYLAARLDVTGTDGVYVKTDQPVALIKSGRRYGKDAGRQDWAGLTKDDVRGLVKNWERMGKPELPVELAEHGSPMCAGFIVDLWTVDEDDGEVMLMGSVKWTYPAANHISVGQLPGMSVEMLKDVKDNMTGADLPGWSLHAAAILTRPFYDDLPKVELGHVDTIEKCVIGIDGFTNEYRIALSAAGKTNEDEMDKEILKQLGLAETATVDEARAALTALIAKSDAASKKVEALEAAEKDAGVELGAMVKLAKAGDKSGEVAVLRAQLDSVTESNGALSTENAGLKTAALGKACDEFIVTGQKDGRIPTKDEAVKLWRSQFMASPDNAKALLATIPPSTTLTGQTGIGQTGDTDDVSGEKEKASAAIANQAAALQAANPKLTVGEAQNMAAAQLSNKK